MKTSITPETLRIDRRRELDLAPLVQRMANAIEDAVIGPWRESGRSRDDLCTAGLLALAATARAIRRAGDLPIEVWAEANRIVNDETSLTYNHPVLPATLKKKQSNG